MSIASELKINLNKVDKYTKHLLYGFTRNIQKDICLIIPDPIIVIILSFYYLPEYFKDFDKSIFQCINTNDTQINTLSDNTSWSSIYGNIMISSDKQQKCIWKLRLNEFSDVFMIGISSICDIDKRFFVNKNSYNYCYYSKGYKGSKEKFETYGTKMGKGDIITMILDCKLKQISFHENDKNLGVAYDKIECGEDIKYKMAIYAYYKNTEIELLEFGFLSK